MLTVECPICGKEFVKNPASIYKLMVNSQRVYYCGYTCYNKQKTKQERGKKAIRRVTKW